jgi:PAS domain S-box-containing protein
VTDPHLPGTATSRELDEHRARLASLVEHHPRGFFVLDLEGCFRSVNGAALALGGGYSEADLIGRPFADLLVDEDLPRLVEHFQALVAGESRRFELRFRRHDGLWGEVDFHGVPVVVAGEVIEIHAAVEDVGAQLQMLAELDEAVHAAESANEAKTLFVATVSHELRTPLTSVLAALELLGETELSDAQRKLHAVMERSGGRLLGLVDEILDFSRVEAGKADLVLDTFSVSELIDWTATTMGPVVREKGLVFATSCDQDASVPLIGDAERLNQVLTNLVGNAAKFTATGSVTLRATGYDTVPGHQGVRFDVVDTGVGLTGEQQRLVFESFRQADASITRQYGGTGLGLAISRKIVALMGGTIEVASMPGRGSTFSVLLSLPRQVLPG